MRSVLDMINYYIVHKNADDSIIEYLKNKLEDSKLEELIIIQIKLLYTDPSDKLVSGLVSFISDKINKILKDIELFDLFNIIDILNEEKELRTSSINNLTKENEIIFDKIKNKDLNDYLENDEDINSCAARMINKTQDNIFNINRLNGEINSISIWLTNLDNSFRKRLDKVNIRGLLECYTRLVVLIDKNSLVNKYIDIVFNKLDKLLLKSDLLDTITNIMPELNAIYKENSRERNSMYKLLDYYIDLLESKIKININSLLYEEKLLLKEKINLICKEILENDDPDDDFKVLVINNYLRYL